jgi:hypothetical protein
MEDEDILSQGGDRAPSPWPRRLAMIVAVVAVVVGGVVYLAVARHPHAPATAAPTHVTASPAPAPTGAAEPTAPPGPDGIGGQTLAWDRSLRLPDAGSQPVWFSPASGDAEQIGGLPASQSGYQFTRVVGGWAVQATPGQPAACGSCAAPPTPVWFLADKARSVTRIGTADRVAPGASAGTVWLTSYSPGVNLTTAAGSAREISATGAATHPVTLPPGYAIDQGTDRGLLLTPVNPESAAVGKLWNPSSRQASQTFSPVLAAGPGEIAWTTGCDSRCAVHTLDLATGKRTVVSLPAGQWVAGGAFSPGGGLLALQVSFDEDDDLAMQLDVTSVVSGRLTAVPGTWVSSDALVGFGWPTASDSLVAEFNFTTKRQLASWHPGDRHPAVTVVQPGPNQAALILG